MQTLFDLVQTLTREEKRLYQLHKREGRTQHIYEAYQKASAFHKGLDQEVYAAHFADVSRAFYSMQKRALMDDILTVLLEYSNNQDPRYQYSRLYGRARVLLERRISEAAVQYSEEALERAQESAHTEGALGALRLQQAALVQGKEPSLRAYEELTQLEERIAEHGRLMTLLQRTLNRLTLLRINVDGEDATSIAAKATTFMQQLQAQNLPEDDQDIQLGRLACEELFYDLIGNPAEYHLRLSLYVREHVEANPHQLPEAVRYELINRHLRSGLAVGDFLMLTGSVYKLNKVLDQLPAETYEVFAPTYLETSALFYFYENDIPAALNQLDRALKMEKLATSQYERLILYRLAMLLAAHLSKQGLEEIVQYRKQFPFLQEHSLVALLEILFLLDVHPNGDEAAYATDRLRNGLRKRKEEKQIQEVLSYITQFLERGRLKSDELHVFPSDWEEILRVDMWLASKAHGSFYYNNLTEQWQQRRRVF